jgi:hypothetical protein
MIIVYLASSLRRYQCDESNSKGLFQGRCALLVNLVPKTSLFLYVVFDSIHLINKAPHLALQEEIQISTQMS